MTHRIILSAVVVSVLSTGVLSAQTPTRQQPTKPTMAQTSSVSKQPSKTVTAKPVASPKSSTKVELKEAQPGLMSQATVKVDDALATALKSYNGRVTSERLEKRGDQIDYVFTIKGKNKVHHVIVDAKTGMVVRPQAHAQKTQPKKSSEK